MILKPQTVTGIVRKGKRVATELGFPSANIPLQDKTLSGSYAAMVAVESRDYVAVAYANSKLETLEAHLLDFSEDIYGKEISVTLYKKISEAVHFDDQEALKRKIGKDVRMTREYFSGAHK